MSLRRVADLASEGAILKPVLHKYLLDGKYPREWTVGFRGEDEEERTPDGWFHPSGHPTMHARQLWYYLNDPEHFESWTPDYVIRMSMLMGTAVHDFVQMALASLGYLVRPKGTCPACGLRQPAQCHEHGVADRETGARGHMDGVVQLGSGLKGFELKTAVPRSLLDRKDNDIEFFKTKWPRYYAQVNEYMRLSGLAEFIVLFFGLGNPWPMVEYRVPADQALIVETERKYREVRTATVPPPPCCIPKSKESRACPAMSCPIKSL